MGNRQIALAVALLSAAPGFAQPAEEVALMERVFAEIQPLSFRDGREYCGYVGLNADGDLIATPATRGRRDSCLAADPVSLEVIYASYHTHGAYEGDEGHEVPSADDMEADADEGVDGYVATPGGRLWFVDSEDMVTFQICGIGCLPSDPDFRPAPSGTIAASYSYDDLVDFLD